MKRARLTVSGLVQGVGFRSYARNNAVEMGLKGFVKNLHNGTIEIILEGYDNQINPFLQILRKGPWGAKVSDIRIEWEEPTNEFKDFRIA